MTKDEVIELAKQAGFADGVVEIVGLYGFMKFAKLVASAARNMTFTQAHWTDYERSIVAVEREECAKLCEQLAMQQDRDVRDECAAAIRARGTHD